MRGLEASAHDVLDRRLLRTSPRPLALALSGGGDSLALTLLADAWATRIGRDLLILTVDHGLQAQSRAWTEACAAVAARLGRPFHALAWTGEKPSAGLPAAARAARHRLLAQAAREAGARVILLGHTADDLREAAAMRAAGATTPDPREWSPSPAWPDGRGLFLLRPLLGAARTDIRAWLTARGEGWIEDPANADPRYARARARQAGATEPAPAAQPAPLRLASATDVSAGVIRLDRAALRDAAAEDVRRFVALACVCAGGGERRPAAARIARAAAALQSGEAVVATLAGARIEADAGAVRIFREAGEAARGGLAPLALEPGRPAVWDGRFEVAVDRPGMTVRALAGLRRRLPPAQRHALESLPPAARGGLPALVDAEGDVACAMTRGTARDLVGERLTAAAGLVSREPD